MTNDLNNSTRSESVLGYFPNLNSDLPNLTFTTIPIKAMISRYYRFQQDYTTALKYLDESMNDNPFIKFNESEKAEIYDILKVTDSFKFYAKEAFFGLPKNQRHFLQYSKALRIDYDSIGLDNAFDIVRNEKDPIFRMVYISANITMDRRSPKTKKIALESRKMFANDKETVLVADYLIHGKKNVDSAIGIAKQGEQYFKSGIYDLASKNYILSAKLNPGDYTHFENAGLSLLRQNRMDESKYYFQYVIDSLNPRNGKSEYLLAGIYEMQGEIKKACKLLEESSSYNFEPAFRDRSKLCLQ